MKKLIIALHLFAIVCLMACGNKTDKVSTTDTVSVDSVDTVLADTVCLD